MIPNQAHEGEDVVETVHVELDGDQTRDGQPEGSLPIQARRALVTLLTSRYVTCSRQRNVWDALVSHEAEIRQRLNEMFLDLVIDRDAEVAFKRQQESEDIPRILRREKPLSRDASFLLIFLRRECVYVDLNAEPAVVTRDQIGEFLRTFRESGDTDAARFERRVDAAINTLVRPLGLLVPDPEVDYLFTISQVIVPLVGVDELQRFAAAFRAAAGGSGDSSDADGEQSPDEMAEEQ